VNTYSGNNILEKNTVSKIIPNPDSVSKTTNSKVLEVGPLESVFPCSESKILDFLVAFQEFDYSISDIAENSGIGFKTTLGVVKRLEAQQVILNTRNVGRALMYRLNMKAKQAQSVNKLAMDISVKRFNLVKNEVEQAKESMKLRKSRKNHDRI